MKFWNAICGFVLLLTFSSLLCKAQNPSSIKFKQKGDTSKNGLRTVSVHFISITSHPLVKRDFLTLPANFATCEYGFFCKEELKVEKSTHLPIRLRLGSLQQCNYYEGKEKNTVYYGITH